MSLTSERQAAAGGVRVVLVGAVVISEIVAIVAIQSLSEFGCTRDGAAETCDFFSSLAARGIALSALGVLYVLARGRSVLPRQGAVDGLAWPWAPLQVLGFLLIVSPALPGGPGFADTSAAVVVWSVGSILAIGGALLWLMPLEEWRHLWRRDRLALTALTAGGLAAPELLAWADRAWEWTSLAEVTFTCVVWLLNLFGEPYSDPANYVIGLGDFAVLVERPCSGIQGLALITTFLIAYLVLQRRELRFPQAWALLPAGLVASFALNIVRIATLILIGASGWPDLAVGAFHSHAGWLIFTLLAFALIGASQKIDWFRRDVGGGANSLPLLRDPAAAKILPLMVFMLAGLAAATVAEVPRLLYPFSATALAVTLVLFAPLVCPMLAGWDAKAVAAGLLVGLAWISLPGAGQGDPALAAELDALGAWTFLLWAGFRLAGTVLLVPIAEEACFRGYVLSRLDRGGATRWVALLISSALFAVLHERWLAAFLAGLVFGALMMRRRRLADPIAAHIAANAVVAAWAITAGDWTLM